jgi:hypothetical protein
LCQQKRKDMKTATFNRVTLSMSRTSSYGHYTISATYRGKQIKAYTTDSEAWDWLDDDSDKELNREAKNHCYNKIKSTYENSL